MVAVALSYRKSYFEGFGLPHACITCRECPEAKIEWGCEEPTQEVQLWIPCPRCSGGDPTCATCKGSGRLAVHRCPRALVTPWESEYRLLHRHWPTAMPCGGGLLEQPLQYIEAMRLLDYSEDLMQKLIRDEEQSKVKKEQHRGV